MKRGRCKISAAVLGGIKSYSEIEQSNIQPSEFRSENSSKKKALHKYKEQDKWVSCAASCILTKQTSNRCTPNIEGDGRRWKQVLVIGGNCKFSFFAECTLSSKNNKKILLVRLEDLDHRNTLQKQGQDGRMKFKHLCGRRNLPKKLE
jgi:hypothetical protein